MNSSSARTVRGFTVADAWREFSRRASPWMFGATLVMAPTARMVVGDQAGIAFTDRMGRGEGARNVLPLLTKRGYAGGLCR